MRVGIVGLGYVGLPLAVAFAAAGAEVLGVDSDAGKVAAVAAGRSYVEDVPDAVLAVGAERGRHADKDRVGVRQAGVFDACAQAR